MPESITLPYPISAAMPVDQWRFKRMLRGIEADLKRGKSMDRRAEKLQSELTASVELRRRRRSKLPRPQYDSQLPVVHRRQEIADAIAKHQVIIVCGETGSGKSTQLPKICLELGRGVDGIIGHTQPRRVAARSVANRIAEELGTPLGSQVGFKIRFTDETRDETYIKLMTDGVLLAETQHDRFLNRYDTIIVDEAHERSLNIDFLLGYLRRLLPKRPDLRVIITSATIDAARFAEFFGSEENPAPVLEVSGRAYPVEVRYRPLSEDEGEPDINSGIAQAIDELGEDGSGDVLVFLSTEREIRDVSRTLKGHFRARQEDVEILPLYARLSTADQTKIFRAHKKRRIVLATNVAESSITVPGVRYVVDTGLARISRYSPRSKIQRLPIEAVSRASADQRKGRCGRVAPGICIRLYTEDDYLGRDEYTTPEIRRTNLAAVILQTLANRLGRIDEFPFIDPPRLESIRDGYKTLFELGAIDARRDLTELGRKLSRLPVDPRIGRMVLAAEDETVLNDVLIIASALEVQDPRERPQQQQEAADAAHKQWIVDDSDFMSLLKLWDFHRHLKESLSHSQLRKACRQNFLSYMRMREWVDVHRQLGKLVRQAGMNIGKRSDDTAAIHRSLLAGLLSNVALKQDRHDYQAVAGPGFYLWPGSATFSRKPKWVMASELLETSRRYLRTVGAIDPVWIEKLAPHLVKRTYNDPHWSKKTQSVMAYETVTLFGLAIVIRRRTGYGPVDPTAAREIFIESALVEGQYQGKEPFYQKNCELLTSLDQLTAKSRSGEFVVDQWTRYQFYFDRVPEDVFDTASLRRWWNRATKEQRNRLFMQESDFVVRDESSVSESQYPDEVVIEETRLALQYQFQPGDEDDGITISVPKECLAQLSENQLGWLVPGMLEEKLLSIIRGLPKSLRRNFVPAPDAAKKAMQMVQFGEGDFVREVARVLTEIAGERIPADAVRTSDLAQHLSFNLRVVDTDGKILAQGRELEQLRSAVGVDAEQPSRVVEHQQWNRDDITRWDFGELPEKIEIQRGDFRVACFPALLDRQESVSLRLLDHRQQAKAETRAGLRRLFCIQERKELRSQIQWFPDLGKIEMYGSTLRHTRPLIDELIELMADRAFFRTRQFPRSEEEFAETAKQGARFIVDAVQDLTKLVGKIFTNYHEVRLALDGLRASHALAAKEDMERQLGSLMFDGFLTVTPWRWLENFPRYLQAMLVRIDKLSDARHTRDRQAMDELHPFLQQFEKTLPDSDRLRFDIEWETYRWMLEEYRVSLFAQELGTIVKVSPQRMEKQWAKVMG